MSRQTRISSLSGGLSLVSCPSKLPAADRPLLTTRHALELAKLFKVMANDTRLRLLHALTRAREMCVSDLAAAVNMTPQAVSNQLQRLADRSIVEARRAGNNIHYRIVDPCVVGLLDDAMCLLEDAQDRKA